MEIARLKKALAGQPAFRYRQAQAAVFSQLINSWQEATVFSQELKDLLSAECPLTIKADVIKEKYSEKALITLEDGLAIESVLIRNKDGRNTVCVSSQVGCPMACAFCATGRQGFKRNLSAAEIVDQVLLFARQLKAEGQRVDNVVFMGMGEPFLNTENVFAAIEVLNDSAGLNIGARSISISTCGMPEGIRALIKFPLQVNLAVSLHAPEDRLRQELMPIAKRYPLRTVWSAIGDYLSERGRKVMIEYIMIAGVNDSEKLALKLAEACHDFPVNLIMINLIPYNPAGQKEFKASDKQVIEKFKRALGKAGIEAVIRESAGGDIAGACGQLAGRQK